MRSLFLQILSVTTINLKSLPQRIWLSLSTVVAVGLVVVVLLSFLAMGNGFRRTIEGSGADDIAIVISCSRSSPWATASAAPSRARVPTISRS
jgi:putative ABC transport system permease protein